MQANKKGAKVQEQQPQRAQAVQSPTVPSQLAIDEKMAGLKAQAVHAKFGP